jgi:hypothetical protein
VWEKWHIITTGTDRKHQNEILKGQILWKESFPRYHGKKESSNGARVAPTISSKEISGDAERQRQTHGGLIN